MNGMPPTCVDDVAILYESSAVGTSYVEAVPGGGAQRQFAISAQRVWEGPDLYIPAAANSIHKLLQTSQRFSDSGLCRLQAFPRYGV